ncbi:MAG: hypothetical protein GVY08_06395 [Bacteroidetes bacterium]|jgi:hypothetical protein|nr:hypothetical protein [Bacteroidota bacterium]
MKNENMTIIDVSEFPDPVSEAFLFMPLEEEEQMDIYTEYVQLGTSVPAGTKLETGYYCRNEMEDGELCDGTIEITQIELPKQIRWTCRRCGDMGALVNYEETIWDKSHLGDDEKDRFLEQFFADIEGEDYGEDDHFYGFGDNESGPLDDFEYYLNPYDPDGQQSGGPTSAEIREMLECNWLQPDSPIYLKGDLPKEEVEQSFFFYNARRFLLILNYDETFQLTRMGNLKRKVVRRLLEEMRWPDNYIENIRSYKNGKLDETDIWLLHGIRVLLTLSGLVQEDDENSTIRFNDDLEYLLEDKHAGELYRRLFSTYFKDMNLGYLGSTFEFPHLQHSVPFISYQLKKYAREWISVEELMHDILLFSVKLELQFSEEGSTEIEFDLLYEDLFAALKRFSLLDTRTTSSNGDLYNADYPDMVRVTSLYNKFVRV